MRILLAMVMIAMLGGCAASDTELLFIENCVDQEILTPDCADLLNDIESQNQYLE